MKPVARAALLAALLAPLLGVSAPGPAAAQTDFAPDTFEDPVARQLYVAALANWTRLDESILRYTARIEQRIAAAIRTPLKDRVIYHNETAVRAFWDQDHDALVQVLGTRSQYPGREIAMREGDMDWLQDLPFDKPFEPGGDRLFFGLAEGDEDVFQPSTEDFWLAHPLGEGADSLYRFQSGDTLTLSFPDGRRLEAIQLDVLPREADSHRISGALWIEPATGALVRAVYRFSRRFDAIRDIPDLQEEEEAGTFRYVPGLFKPWTFDLTLMAVDYGLWDFEVWLPRSMRMEGEAGAGIIKVPVSMDLSYRIESVTMADDEAVAEPDAEIESARAPAAPRAAREAAADAADAGGAAQLQEVHFKTRAEAMAFIARLLSDDDGIDYELMSDREMPARDRESFLIVPSERSLVANSPHLPPPIWRDAIGFPSDDEIEEYMRSLADLPALPVQTVPWSFNWGWARHDLLRYNRVEGPAVGGQFETDLPGRHALGGSAFFGFADLRPKVRLELRKSTVLRRLTFGAFHELRPTDPTGRYLDFGNSFNALFFGRDDGEYYRAAGADLTWRPPDGRRDSFLFRAYGERQSAVAAETDFALFRALDGQWRFRPNLVAGDVEEAGAELRLSPWWGNNPTKAQLGLELSGRGAVWRVTGEQDRWRYGQASATLRGIVPVLGEGWRRLRLGAEVGAGTTWGDAPVQRHRFLGAAATLRGYPASTLSGSSFARARLELSRAFEGVSLILFGDAGWAGSRALFDRDDILYGIGVGGSVLDGLIRVDFSQGLRGPAKDFRIDLYLDAIL